MLPGLGGTSRLKTQPLGRRGKILTFRRRIFGEATYEGRIPGGLSPAAVYIF